jgi:hypothetical protein
MSPLSGLYRLQDAYPVIYRPLQRHLRGRDPPVMSSVASLFCRRQRPVESLAVAARRNVACVCPMRKISTSYALTRVVVCSVGAVHRVSEVCGVELRLHMQQDRHRVWNTMSSVDATHQCMQRSVHVLTPFHLVRCDAGLLAVFGLHAASG